MAQRPVIEIQGIDDVRRMLRQIDPQLTKLIEQVNSEASDIVVREAGPRVPIGSTDDDRPGHPGKLWASLRAKPTKQYGQVTAGSAAVPYAGPIHFGWPDHNIQPQPFLTGAALAKEPEIVSLYDKRVHELTEKAQAGGLAAGV